MFRSSQPPEPAGFGVGCKATVLLLLAGGALAGCGGSHPATTSTTTQISKLDVKLEASPRLRTATPQFALRNSLGHRVRLSQFRGRAVILTFIYDHCPDTCPLRDAARGDAAVWARAPGGGSGLRGESAPCGGREAAAVARTRRGPRRERGFLTVGRQQPRARHDERERSDHGEICEYDECDGEGERHFLDLRVAVSSMSEYWTTLSGRSETSLRVRCGRWALRTDPAALARSRWFAASKRERRRHRRGNLTAL